MNAFSPLKVRKCVACKHNDYAETLTKFSVRHYRHKENWKTRCDWFKANPQASLSEAKASGLNGVAQPLTT